MRSHAQAPSAAPTTRPAAALALAAALLALALGASSAQADTLPTITTDPASEVGVTTAKLSGKANPNGAPGDGPTSWRLEYSPQGQEAWSQANAGTIEAPASEEGNDVPVEAIFGFGGELQPGQEYEFRLIAENAAGQAQTPSPYPTFTMGAATAPTLTIDPASGVQHTTAHLEGTIDPEGGNENPIGGPLAINWTFQVSTDGGATWSDANGGQGEVSASEPEGGGSIPALGDDPITVEADVSGLVPNKSYEARLTAHYANKEASSSSVSFATPAITPPTIQLDPIGLDGESATLTGTVNPNGFDTSYWVEYRKQGASAWEIQPFNTLLQEPAPISLGSGTDPVAISQTFTAEPSSTYEYRLATQGLEGTFYEGPHSFTTPAVPPTVATGTVGALTHDGARLTAYVDPNNTPTTATFEYDTDPSFASPATAPAGPGSNVTGNGNQVAYADVTGVDPDTTYYWRVKAQSAAGSDQDEAPRSFDTYSPPPEPGSCPNEALREKQGSTYLSNCRAWELVSTGDKNVPVMAADISNSGNRVRYRLYGGSDQTSAAPVGELLSDRTSFGWEVSNATPPRSAVGDFGQVFVLAASPELDALTMAGLPGQLGREGPGQFFRYLPQTASLTPEASLVPISEISSGSIIESSVDQSHIYSISPANGNRRVYSFAGSEPEIVSLLPNGDVPGCAVTFALEIASSSTSNWVSDDGSRVFFEASDATCSTPYHLYMREGGPQGTTTLLAGPPETGPDFGVGSGNGGGFIQATPDGSEVFFVTATRITAEDTNESSDLYRHTLGEGNECLTCVVPEAEVLGPLVAENGKRAYFLSSRALAPGATPGQTNAYVWRADAPEKVAFVASLTSNEDWRPTSFGQNVIATPNGAALVFSSDRPELNALSGRSNGGLRQLYRYDDRSGTLDCITCLSPPREVTTASSAHLPGCIALRQIQTCKPLSEDGHSLFFATPESLVPEDVNNAADAYEWRDGRASLLTDGSSVGKLELAPASADGRDVLFIQSESLTPDVRDGSLQLYDARVNGGFPSLYEQPQAPCAGDGCRGAQGSPPVDATLATPSFSGPGNPRPMCAKGKARKKGRCVKKKPRKRRSSKSRANSNRRSAK